MGHEADPRSRRRKVALKKRTVAGRSGGKVVATKRKSGTGKPGFMT